MAIFSLLLRKHFTSIYQSNISNLTVKLNITLVDNKDAIFFQYIKIDRKKR